MNDFSENVIATLAWLTAVLAFAMLAYAAVPKENALRKPDPPEITRPSK